MTIRDCCCCCCCRCSVLVLAGATGVTTTDGVMARQADRFVSTFGRVPQQVQIQYVILGVWAQSRGHEDCHLHLRPLTCPNVHVGHWNCHQANGNSAGGNCKNQSDEIEVAPTANARDDRQSATISWRLGQSWSNVGAMLTSALPSCSRTNAIDWGQIILPQRSLVAGPSILPCHRNLLALTIGKADKDSTVHSMKADAV
jgi:hypothetical protein